MKWIRSIDLKQFATGCDAFGSAANDVSAISLKSTGRQKEHIYFNQNAETSVAMAKLAALGALLATLVPKTTPPRAKMEAPMAKISSCINNGLCNLKLVPKTKPPRAQNGGVRISFGTPA